MKILLLALLLAACGGIQEYPVIEPDPVQSENNTFCPPTHVVVCEYAAKIHCFCVAEEKLPLMESCLNHPN
jgi:hypothetical protein